MEEELETRYEAECWGGVRQLGGQQLRQLAGSSCRVTPGRRHSTGSSLTMSPELGGPRSATLSTTQLHTQAKTGPE